MGREVRMVPPDWEHPKDESGSFVPLLDGSYAERAQDWDKGWAKWQEGLRENYGEGPAAWVPHDGGTYTDWDGRRPSPDDYMPLWSGEDATHFMMYEDTSGGTPISPAFETPEELARWLVDNAASAFAGETASYEAWLRVAGGGFTPSAVVSGGIIQSGVEALKEETDGEEH